MAENGIKSAKILLPNTTDMTAWSVIACDQFTSENEYWEELEKKVSGKPTTLDLILPEIYLDEKTDERIAKINKNIESYLAKNLFKSLGEGYILTVRKTPFVERRIGLVGAVDLEKYEYSKKSEALIRSTEGTIEERIPPRLKIRKDAAVEFPHIMILFDDEKKEILESLYENRNQYQKVYDFELNMGGGRIEGYFISDCIAVEKAFLTLLDSERLIKKYGKDDKFQFAVGDGNHSLATAKAHWNNIKIGLTAEEIKTHPARYALAEFNNIYDEGIYFEPIFRFVSGVNRADFIDKLSAVNGGKMGVYSEKEQGVVWSMKDNSLPQGIMEVDAFIKEYIEKFGGTVDYVHGEDNLIKLVDKGEDTVGILFNKLDKKDLFRYVSQKGAFPRKTFSMGENIEKRYYLEGRKIKC